MGFKEYLLQFLTHGFMSDTSFLILLAVAFIAGVAIVLIASQKTSPGFTPGRIVVAIIVALLTCAFATLPYVVVQFQSYKSGLYEPFEKRIKEYTWVKAVKPKGRNIVKHLFPAVIPIDITRNIVDQETFTALGAGLKPIAPDSVRTIAWIRRDTVRAGGFLDGSSFMAIDCEVMLFDKATSVQIDSLWFLGDRTLPKTKKQDPMRKPVYGPAPINKIIAYLDSLSNPVLLSK